jgi:hypothetical protein
MIRKQRFYGIPLTAATLALAALLAGCASDPSRLTPGRTKAEALQQLGTPTAIYPLSSGERLQYSRAPAGTEVNNVDLDAAGRVVSVRQELDEGLFGSTIEPGVWHVADVLRTYGRPMEISQVTSFDGVIWSWRYRAMNSSRFLYIYIDPQGGVDHYSVGDDLTRDRLFR